MTLLDFTHSWDWELFRWTAIVDIDEQDVEVLLFFLSPLIALYIVRTINFIYFQNILK